MMTRLLRRLAVPVAAAASVLLTGCLLSPGTFTSELDIRRDGSFKYSYRGDIHLLPLSQPATASADESEAAFAATTCQNEETFEERPCTADELARQRKEWDEGREAAKQKQKQEAEQVKTLLGGIDPADPRAAEEFASRLRRQAGWRSVVNKGQGRFEVDFAISGRLDHDFVFPTMERMPILTPFVTIFLRSDNSLRVEAPAFHSAANANPVLGLAQGIPSTDGGGQTGMPELNGTFTIVTDAEILANNTDEGPIAGAGGKRLAWKVNARTPAAPSALLKLR